MGAGRERDARRLVPARVAARAAGRLCSAQHPAVSEGEREGGGLPPPPAATRAAGGQHFPERRCWEM